MSRRTALLALLAAEGALLLGVPSVAEAALHPTPLDPESRLIGAMQSFGFRLLTVLAERRPEENVFISPLSISLLLSLILNGARGETAHGIARALGVDGLQIDRLNKAYGGLASTLSSQDHHVQISIANALWLRRGLPLQRSFLEIAKRDYRARVSSLDFSRPDASRTINAWADEETRGNIPIVVGDTLNPESVLLAMNAVYFHGDWTHPFDRAETRKRPFSLPSGGHVLVPFMSRDATYPYHEDELAQVVSLSYGSGAWQMYLFLPRPGVSLERVWRSLSPAIWRARLAKLQDRPGRVRLPRFTIRYRTSLDAPLIHMGMARALDRERADLGGLVARRRVAIDSVEHLSLLRVDERGTTAAAVTGVQFGITAIVAPRDPFTMIVDRPFLCAIGDTKTGTILFIGAISRPDAS